jgi:hypothetical protein
MNRKVTLLSLAAALASSSLLVGLSVVTQSRPTAIHWVAFSLILVVGSLFVRVVMSLARTQDASHVSGEKSCFSTLQTVVLGAILSSFLYNCAGHQDFDADKIGLMMVTLANFLASATIALALIGASLRWGSPQTATAPRAGAALPVSRA